MTDPEVNKVMHDFKVINNLTEKSNGFATD